MRECSTAPFRGNMDSVFLVLPPAVLSGRASEELKAVGQQSKREGETDDL